MRRKLHCREQNLPFLHQFLHNRPLEFLTGEGFVVAKANRAMKSFVIGKSKRKLP